MEQQCCTDAETTNPKTYSPMRRNHVKGMPYNLVDPIPAEIKDEGETKNFFENYKDTFIPYAGRDLNTSHTYLTFLVRLSLLSATKGAINEGLKRYSFAKIDINYKTDPIFDISQDIEEPTYEEKESFVQFMKDSIFWHGVDEMPCNQKRFAEFCSDEWNSSGNIYVELVHVETLGLKKTYVYVHKAENCLYLKTKKRQQRYIAISPIWTNNYIKDNPPDVLPLFPTFDIENGTKRTIIHIKNGNNTWYGRPKTQNTVREMYGEAKLIEHLNKECGNRFLGNLILEDEDDNPELYQEEEASREEGYSNLAEQIQQNFSADAAQVSTVFYKTRGFGSKPMLVHQVTSQTNESFYKGISDFLESEILKSAGWSKNFLTGEIPTGFSTQQFLDEYKMKILPTVLENSRVCGNELQNLIIQEVIKFHNKTEFEGLGINFKDLFFDTRKTIEDENANNRVGGNTTQSSE